MDLKIHLATTALCTCSLIHAFVLISVFPYAGFMAISLLPNRQLTTETAGPYAGILASSFMAGRALSAYPFGKLADVYGRVFVLMTSLTLSAVFSILFGLSQSFGRAMLWRFLMGLSNGIVGTVKTVVSEMASEQQPLQDGDGDTIAESQPQLQPQPHADNRNNNNNNKTDNKSKLLETRIMGMVVGMRAWGFLISPAIGGWLAEPIRQYPALFNNYNSSSHTALSMLHHLTPWLSKFPFFLPNLGGAILCMSAAILVMVAVDETLPQDKRRSVKCIPRDGMAFILSKLRCCGCCGYQHLAASPGHSENTPLLPATKTATTVDCKADCQTLTQQIDSTETSCGTGGANSGRDDNQTRQPAKSNHTTTMKGLWQNQATKQHLVAYWLFSFAVVCLDESFPLFCISTQGGLGLAEGSIGQVLSMAGLIFALSQYTIYVQTVDRFGLYSSLWIGCWMGFLPVLFIPVSLILNWYGGRANGFQDVSSPSSPSPPLHWSAFLLLMIIMAVSKIFCCMFFSSISIALNKTVDTSQRAALNGLATLGGSVAKGAGPIVAGVLVSVSYACIRPQYYGSLVIFAVVSIMGLAVSRSLVGLQANAT